MQVTVKVVYYLVQISPEIHRTLHYLPPGIGTHFFCYLPWENAAHFLKLKPFTQYQSFIPPGTHYYWVDRGVDSKFAQGLLHMTNTAGIEPQTS